MGTTTHPTFCLYSDIGNILTATEGYSIITQSVKDLNNPPKSFILQTTTEPIGYPVELTGNACVVLQQNPGREVYTAQVAFSFGSNKIAIRRKAHINEWSDWAYITLI